MEPVNLLTEWLSCCGRWSQALLSSRASSTGILCHCPSFRRPAIRSPTLWPKHEQKLNRLRRQRQCGQNHGNIRSTHMVATESSVHRFRANGQSMADPRNSTLPPPACFLFNKTVKLMSMNQKQENLPQTILNHVNRENYKPVKPRVICKQLKLTQDDFPQLRKAIKKLVRSGKLKYGPKHLIMSVAPKPEKKNKGENGKASG